ncbi:hotdog family protein [Undibacterium sp. TS12]|uniref:hotdog family protein n=1 Tax=Undibacterium sp. TS12 TaxID=2908202 RepID=UPI00321A3306
MSQMYLPAVRDVVPHSGEMVLLDRLLAVDDETLCAEVRIESGTLFCDANGVGSWVGIEYMAQAIAAHAGYLATIKGEPVKVGFLLGSRRYEASVPLFALGSVLHIHVLRAMQGDNGLGAFECRIEDSTSRTVLANATVTVFQPDNVKDFLQRS